MSDLEEQAASWVPPWQRPPAPAPQPAAGTPADVSADPSANAEVSADTSAQTEAFGDSPADVSVSTDTSDDVSAATDESTEPEGETPAESTLDLLAAAVPGQRARPKAARQTPVDPAQPGQVQPGHAQGCQAQAGQVDAASAGGVEVAAQFAEPLPALTEAELVPAIEAILMVVDEPLSENTLSQVLEVPAEQIANALVDLSMAYTRQGRGFDLRRAAGGWRYYTRAEYSPYVERFVLDGQQLRLTQASLETLAVIAYKQPVTRSRISAIRGVNCDGVIRTLVARGMIEECGTEPESGAHLYRTTTLFLEKVGLDSVDQLPPLAPFLPDNLEEIANGE